MPQSREPWEVWNSIDKKFDQVGLSGLEESERALYLVNRFLCAFENGGYTGFLYNVSPSEGGQQWTELRATADAIEIVGHKVAAAALYETASLMESANLSAAATWGHFLALADPEAKRVQLEDALGRRRSELWQRLEEFTEERFGARSSFGASDR